MAGVVWTVVVAFLLVGRISGEKPTIGVTGATKQVNVSLETDSVGVRLTSPGRPLGEDLHLSTLSLNKRQTDRQGRQLSPQFSGSSDRIRQGGFNSFHVDRVRNLVSNPIRNQPVQIGNGASTRFHQIGLSDRSSQISDIHRVQSSLSNRVFSQQPTFHRQFIHFPSTEQVVRAHPVQDHNGQSSQIVLNSDPLGLFLRERNSQSPATNRISVRRGVVQEFQRQPTLGGQNAGQTFSIIPQNTFQSQTASQSFFKRPQGQEQRTLFPQQTFRGQIFFQQTPEALLQQTQNPSLTIPQITTPNKSSFQHQRPHIESPVSVTTQQLLGSLSPQVSNTFRHPQLIQTSQSPQKRLQDLNSQITQAEVLIQRQNLSQQSQRLPQQPHQLPQQPQRLVTQQPHHLSQQPQRFVSQQPQRLVSQQSQRPSPQPQHLVSQQPQRLVSQQSQRPSPQPQHLVSQQPQRLVSQQPQHLVSQQPQRLVSQQPQHLVSQQPQHLVSHQPQHLVSQQPQHLVSQQPQHLSQQQPQHLSQQQPQHLSQQQPQLLSQQQPQHLSQQQPQHLSQQQPQHLVSQEPLRLSQQPQSQNQRLVSQQSHRLFQQPQSQLVVSTRTQTPVFQHSPHQVFQDSQPEKAVPQPFQRQPTQLSAHQSSGQSPTTAIKDLIRTGSSSGFGVPLPVASQVSSSSGVPSQTRQPGHGVPLPVASQMSSSSRTLSQTRQPGLGVPLPVAFQVSSSASLSQTRQPGLGVPLPVASQVSSSSRTLSQKRQPGFGELQPSAPQLSLSSAALSQTQKPGTGVFLHQTRSQSLIPSQGQHQFGALHIVTDRSREHFGDSREIPFGGRVNSGLASAPGRLSSGGLGSRHQTNPGRLTIIQDNTREDLTTEDNSREFFLSSGSRLPPFEELTLRRDQQTSNLSSRTGRRVGISVSLEDITHENLTEEDFTNELFDY